MSASLGALAYAVEYVQGANIETEKKGGGAESVRLSEGERGGDVCGGGLGLGGEGKGPNW